MHILAGLQCCNAPWDSKVKWCSECLQNSSLRERKTGKERRITFTQIPLRKFLLFLVLHWSYKQCFIYKTCRPFRIHELTEVCYWLVSLWLTGQRQGAVPLTQKTNQFCSACLSSIIRIMNSSSPDDKVICFSCTDPGLSFIHDGPTRSRNRNKVFPAVLAACSSPSYLLVFPACPWHISTWLIT